MHPPPPAQTKLPSEEAKAILRERAEVYGSATDAFRRIALAWTAVLDHDITPVDVARCMAALKLIRDALNPDHKDSLVDLINYADIAETLKNA